MAAIAVSRPAACASRPMTSGPATLALYPTAVIAATADGAATLPVALSAAGNTQQIPAPQPSAAT
ncbi:hypothetical protein Aph02nite_66720 [Actinoplanes philippinensis]|nr:hypothetical protein Aph02nite_66720 [Actinoplanes philippinensis]